MDINISFNNLKESRRTGFFNTMQTFNQEEFNNFIKENNIYGFFEEPITLVSGRISHFYVNWRDITKDVWLTDRLTDYIISFVKEKNIKADTFYGVPEAASKLGILTQYKWAKMSDYFKGSHSLSMGRAKAKDHGMPKDRFFVGMPEGKVVVIEDLVTVATNLVPTLEKLREAGVDISAVVVLANRMERRDDGLSVREAVEKMGIQFFEMSSALEILPAMYEKTQPDDEIGRKVEEYYRRYGLEQIKLVKLKFLGKEISGVFTIPSGIITTSAKIIEEISSIPEIGVITTKSIGLEPREGNREPILTQYAPGCFINAVGLANPGAKQFVEQLKEINLPKDKFLLISIFGKDTEEFVRVAKILSSHADGLELNLSCPHAKGYGRDVNSIQEIIKAVKKAVDIPIVAKVGSDISVEDVKEADAICAINTVGPGYYTIDGSPVLTNENGGLSGKGILPLGLKCVKEISQTVNIPIIGCGGISNADDVRAYQQAGASIFGIGSALAGLSFGRLKNYFSILNNDLETGENSVSLKPVDIAFKKYKLVENRKIADKLSLLVFDQDIYIKPGQFVFAWISGVGEKPFSVLDNKPLTLAVQKRGCFSEKLIGLEKGAEAHFRGPYGVPVKMDSSKIVLVGGGCGLAALYQIAKRFRNTEVFVGARNRDYLFYIDQLKKVAEVHIATNDGSAGFGGYITDLLGRRLNNSYNDAVFFNCGPEEMITRAVNIERQYVSEEKIYNSIDYIAKCGVGLCGSCATKEGKRLCVDGPFIRE